MAMTQPAIDLTPLDVRGDMSPVAGCGPRIVVFTTLFPNPRQPRLGVFVRDRVVAVAAHCPSRVVAPILTRLVAQHLDRGPGVPVPRMERHAGFEVYHPRFTTLPGVGRVADALLLFLQTLPAVRRLHATFAFEAIDAHYAFPDGAAALLLGRHFGVPVCVTLRGGDIDLLPRFRMRRRVIQRTLRRADRVFAVSQHLARGAVALGLPPKRLRIIPNGIDPHTFSPMDRSTARAGLKISMQQPLLLCVGNLLAEKGQHVLIDALDVLRRRGTVAPHLTIVGSDQWGKRRYTEQLKQRIRELGLASQVTFAGSQPQAALRQWYSAADLLVLPTFREGCPNVVREALACGTPVVASNVGGVPELIGSDAVGLLVAPGDVVGLAGAIEAALQREWDRAAIATVGGQRTWSTVGALVASELRALAEEGSH